MSKNQTNIMILALSSIQENVWKLVRLKLGIPHLHI